VTTVTRIIVWMLALALAAMGCGPGADDSPPPSPAADGADAGEGGAANGEAPVCLRAAPFVADGPVPTDRGGPGDAARVQALRWHDYDACERVVIDLARENGGAASAAGAVDVALLRELGVVRVSLRDVEWVQPDATDASFGGDLARSAYAVWSPDGRWTFVDLHLAAGAEAAATVLPNPARVVVDLRPGGGAFPGPPLSTRRVVVLQPRPGSGSYPLTVTGYARTFEANVVARLERDGEKVHETFTTATASVDAWGHFSITIQDGPPGPVRLHVGEYSAKDGTWEGAAIDLRMR
jgi:hypothetical protein